MHATPGDIRTQTETGGGTLYDLGVYCINAARVFLGAEPNQVYAYSIDGDRSGMPEVDDTTSAILRFDNDRLATFTTSFDAADVSSFRVDRHRGRPPRRARVRIRRSLSATR